MSVGVDSAQIPPKWLVRTVAIVLLVIGFALMYFAGINFGALDWWFAVGAFLAGFSVAGAALASLITGNPEWILLNLILPG